MKNNSMEFAKRIKDLRTSKGLSQEKLAELSGLHPTYIGQIERNEKNPTIDTVYKLAYGLEIPLSSFFKNLESESGENTYATKIYNQVLALSPKRQEKIYKIVKEIIDL